MPTSRFNATFAPTIFVLTSYKSKQNANFKITSKQQCPKMNTIVSLPNTLKTNVKSKSASNQVFLNLAHHLP